MKRRLMLTLALVLACVATSRGQDMPEPVCTLQMSEEDCVAEVFRAAGRTVGAPGEPAESLSQMESLFLAEIGVRERQAPARAAEELANQFVAGENLLSALGSTKTDLYSVLSLLLDSGSLSKEDSGAIKIDLSPILGLDSNRFRLGATVGGAAVYEPLEKALEASELGDELNTAEEGLDDFSAVTVAARWSPMNRTRGRSRAAIEMAMARLFQAARGKESDLRAARQEAATEREELLGKIAKRLEAAGEDLPLDAGGDLITSFDALPGDVAGSYMRLVETAARARAQYLTGLERTLADTRFPEMSQLADNQPQLVIELSHSFRDQAVGPEQTVGSVTYEMGWPNVNGLENHCDQTVTPSCYQTYLARFGDEAPKMGNRLSFSFKYTDIERFGFSLPDEGFDFSEDSQRKLIYSLAYGRNLAVEGKIATRRLELAVDREDVEKDSMRNDRTKASLTLAQRINKETSLVLGAVWASDPEFRDGVDKEFSAHFGISYKLIKVDKN